MTTSSFIKQLLLISVGAAAVLLGLHQIPVLAPYSGLSWISAVGFVLFSLLLFWMGQKGAKSSNDQLFVQLFLVATLLKMALCIGLVWWYFRTWQPNTSLFVVPFFITYCIYTVFEMHFLGKVAKQEEYREEEPF